MSRLVDTINQMRQDLVPLEMTKDEYLAICAKIRIDNLTDKYDKEFDKLLKKIEDTEFSSHDVIELSSHLKHFSSIVTSLYTGLTEDFERYQRNLLNETDK